MFCVVRTGVVAGMDEATSRFKYPLILTGVRPFSEAACAGLRSGDQVVSLHRGPGHWNTKNARAVEGIECPEGQYKGRVVDDETQALLRKGGAMRMRFKLAPRCENQRCEGRIVESEDSFDH